MTTVRVQAVGGAGALVTAVVCLGLIAACLFAQGRVMWRGQHTGMHLDVTSLFVSIGDSGKWSVD